MFQILPAVDNRLSEFLYNTATNERVPLNPAEKPLETLQTLGGLVEDDLLFLLPFADGDGYTFKGFVTCFPNGFNTAKKLNLKLRDIHKPVPHYGQKLEKSMDRYFSKLKVGKFSKRANVSCIFTAQVEMGVINRFAVDDHHIQPALHSRRQSSL